MNGGRFNLVNMLASRQRGLPVVGCFQRMDKWKINKAYIPKRTIPTVYEHTLARRIVFSSTGDALVTVGSNFGICMYDTRYPRYQIIKLIHPAGSLWAIGDVAISPDDSYIIYTGFSDRMHLSSIDTNEQRYSFSLTSDIDVYPTLLCFSKRSNTIFVGATDKNIHFFDLTTRSCIRRIEAHSENMSSIAIASDASQVIYSSDDGVLINVIDIRTEQPLVGAFTGHTSGVFHIDSKGDSRYLISTSYDETVKLWDLRVLSAHNLRNEELYMSMQYMSNNGNMQRNVVDGSVMTYVAPSGVRYSTFAKFSPLRSTGQQFFTIGCDFGKICVYDLTTATIETVLEGNVLAIRDATWHPYRNEIVSCDAYQHLQLWNY